LSKRKIKIDKELYDKLERIADAAGYSSTEEFIIHVLEREAAKIDDDSSSDEEIKKRLEGLGYIS
jgi:metal-responsive CopG/Arc/MetJ family transcriptional regulator